VIDEDQPEREATKQIEAKLTLTDRRHRDGRRIHHRRCRPRSRVDTLWGGNGIGN